MFKVNDLVTRSSYSNDVIFRIISIDNGNVKIKGEVIRLIADAPISDLVSYDVRNKVKFALPSLSRPNNLIGGRILHPIETQRYLQNFHTNHILKKAQQHVATGNDNKGDMPVTVNVHGTIRTKYEYQTEEGEGRFEVRNARIALTGSVAHSVDYKAEIDLSDEGNIKMLDAYAKIKPARALDFTIGQMRVPFTIDAHRSPHQQYFANRSFIAKQVGNVRDVGATLGYNLNVGFPIVLQAGLFNGF